MSRYSQLYIEQAVPLPDSARARYRLGKLMESSVGDTATSDLSEMLEGELGIKIGAFHAYHWTNFTKSCAVRDILDTVTVTFQFIRRRGGSASAWVTQVQRIFAEERLAYEIDNQGIVHPAIDKEFQRNRLATVAGLQMPRYANSLAAFSRIAKL